MTEDVEIENVLKDLATTTSDNTAQQLFVQLEKMIVASCAKPCKVLPIGSFLLDVRSKDGDIDVLLVLGVTEEEEKKENALLMLREVARKLKAHQGVDNLRVRIF